MRRLVRLVFALFIVVGLGGWAGPISAAPTSSSSTASPAATWDSLNNALFLIQAGLLGGDSAAVEAQVADARGTARDLIAMVPSTSDPVPDLGGTVDMIGNAATTGDQVEVARLRGIIEGQVYQIGYASTVGALSAHDVDTARSWLLVRLFTQSTRLARPSSDSTLALEAVRAGTMDPAAAIAIVTADLLDTYQSEIQRQLDDLIAGTAKSQLRTAQSIGIVQSLWPMLSDSYATQLGEAARTDLVTAIDALTVATVSADRSVVGTVDTALGNFRAAPLTSEEQSGRARQLILYMGLVPKEYGRGVRGGEVVSAIEVQEASTFLTGARAAFSDLRPSLNQVDPATTQQLAEQLVALSALIDGSMAGTTITDPDVVKEAVGSIESTFRDLVPGEWLQAGGDADYDVVISLLEQMETAAAAGQFKQAESARLEAYAVFDAGAEKRLLAFAPSLAQTIETGFWGGTSNQPGLATLLANGAPIGEITIVRQALVRDLTEARQQLGSGSTASGAVIFNAGSIVFREGLEAVLILASLLASMTGENKRLKRPLALGSSLALAASVVLFILARTILLSLSQYSERVEAIVSLVAIGVLLLVMNWFFHKVYWTKWIASHHKKRRVVIAGVSSQVIGMIVLGFTSVFREGAETVLFLQALVLDAGTRVVIEGTFLGLAATFVVGFLMFALQAKLPHKKMLMVTGVMISLVLVMMVGKTVHVLQAVGWLTIHPIGDTPPPYWMSLWLGVFNTWEGVVAQVVALVFVFGSYFAAEFSHKRAQKEMIARAESMPRAMA